MICWSLACEETKTCLRRLSITSTANRSSTGVSDSPVGSSQSLNLFLYWTSLSSVWAPMGLDKLRNVFGLLRFSSCGIKQDYELGKLKLRLQKKRHWTDTNSLNRMPIYWHLLTEDLTFETLSFLSFCALGLITRNVQKQVCTSESKSARIHGKTGYCIRSLYDLPASVLRCIKYWKLLISPLCR